LFRAPARYDSDDDDDVENSHPPHSAKKPSKAPLHDKQLNDLFTLPDRPQPIIYSATTSLLNSKAVDPEVTGIVDSHQSHAQIPNPGPPVSDQLANPGSSASDLSPQVGRSSETSEPPPSESPSSVNPNLTQITPPSAAIPNIQSPAVRPPQGASRCIAGKCIPVDGKIFW